MGFILVRKCTHALRKSKDRIGDINAQVEDTLAGIRVVKSLLTKRLKKRNLLTKTTDFLRVEEMAIKMRLIFMTV